ncbi:hypothetical protein BDN72DRAFT_956741 [Pluteus cervinus]|uniref:Uncharacterized protein n=1 Tax=Pluteus cervinus TaxID=181527 RepID=A0ACD3B624_9AGAR|nr:hypothetical protein BDN72DRAFT_956741 [Pluteus cervinus]
MEALQLPPEVLHMIITGQSRKKLVVLRQVCRTFNQIVEPLLFSTITLTDFNTSNAPLDPFYNFLESLANGTTNAGAHVRNLLVMRVTPPDVSKTLDETKADGKNFKGDHEEKMKKWLLRALGSLKSLRCVSWTPSNSDPQWIQDCITQYLVQLPTLEEFNIKWIYKISGKIRLDQISNLKKLSVKGTTEIFRAGLLEQAISIVSNSPNLTSLAMSDDDYDASDDTSTFDLFFDVLPTSLPPLRLTEVISSYFPLRLGEVALQHVKGLKSLTLEGKPDEEPDDVDGNEEEDWEINWAKDEEEDGEGKGSSPCRPKLQPNPVLVRQIQDRRPKSTAFWNKLRLSDIQLERLHLEDVDHSALGYLASYNGLRALHFPDIDASRGAIVDHLTTTFFTEVLPMHVETLEELTVVSAYLPAWSLNAQILNLFAQCKNLRTLHVSWEPNAAGSIKTLYSLLDLSKSLPCLQSLTISFAYPRFMRVAPCGNPWIRRRDSYRKKATEIFPGYEQVDKTKNLYMVEAGGLKFKLRPSEDSKGYRYQFAPPKARKKVVWGDC